MAGPVILSHGFPYGPSVFDDVTPSPTRAKAQVVLPYLRGYGPTQLLSLDTTRSGQQAALASDLLAFIDALGLQEPIVEGFD